jgi:soluble lytic murein transglycosylase-like protein
VVLHHGLALVGMAALMMVLAQGGKFLPHLWSGEVADAAQSALVAEAQADEAEVSPKYKALAEFLAHRYKVATDATEEMVSAAHLAGEKTGLDPLLILAVMAIESRFNPIAESPMGAKGLMQVMPRDHQDQIADLDADNSGVLDPSTNILVGARILKEYILRAGSPEAGLQMYAGAPSDTSNLYAQKVLAEKDRLAQVVKKNEPRARPHSAARPAAQSAAMKSAALASRSGDPG